MRTSTRVTFSRGNTEPPDARVSKVKHKSVKKVGRPPLEKGEKRSRQLRVRITGRELDKIRASAKASGQTISMWMRSMMFFAIKGIHGPVRRSKIDA
jgi:hypothetical protein